MQTGLRRGIVAVLLGIAWTVPSAGAGQAAAVTPEFVPAFTPEFTPPPVPRLATSPARAATLPPGLATAPAPAAAAQSWPIQATRSGPVYRALADPDEPFFTTGDAWLALGFAAGTLAMAPLDLELAEALRDSTLQVHGTLADMAEAARLFAFPGTALVSGSLYAAGRFTHSRELAAMGMHSAEAVVLSYLLVTAGKNLLGRARPDQDPHDPYDFQLGRGLEGAEYRSLPSGHSAGAFAFAAAVTAETREHWPSATPYVAALLYTGAAMAGVSRMYHNRHWASDTVLGAAIGTFSGLKVVRYHYRNPNNPLDRWFLPATMAPTESGLLLLWRVPVR